MFEPVTNVGIFSEDSPIHPPIRLEDIPAFSSAVNTPPQADKGFTCHDIGCMCQKGLGRKVDHSCESTSVHSHAIVESILI